jgi:hypothetical protein
MDTIIAYFRFPFQGEDWQNHFLVGAAMAIGSFIVPILPFIFFAGYLLAVMRQTIHNQALELPAWDDWGRLAKDGLRAIGVGLVFMGPGFLIALTGQIIYFGWAVSMPFMLESERSPEAFGGMFFLVFVIFFISMGLGILLSVLGMIPFPVAIAHMIYKERFSAAFAVREWWPILKANASGYFVAWVIMLGLGGMLYFVMMILYMSLVLCLFIPLIMGPLYFYMLVVTQAFFGTAYRSGMPQETAEQAS